MWIKWKRPGSRGRRGECVCTLNQNSTEPLNQLGLCLSRWFGKLGNSVIVRRLKGDHCLPEAGRVGGVLSWFSLLRPPFVSLRSCILTAALCQGPDCFGCVLWENQVPGFVKPLTMNGRARPQTHTHTHTRRIFTRLINLCLCADGNHRKKEIYSEGLRRSRSYISRADDSWVNAISSTLVITDICAFLLFFFIFSTLWECVPSTIAFLFTPGLFHPPFKAQLMQ